MSDDASRRVYKTNGFLLHISILLVCQGIFCPLQLIASQVAMQNGQVEIGYYKFKGV